MAQEIDYVVPMVFPEDSRWQRDLDRRRMYHESGTLSERYRSWGTEELLVDCIRRNMPWVRNIIILLARDSQRQEWMNDYETLTDQPKLRVVYHREFIPSELLPTFNSATIEMFLHRIPKLSECFLYGNDDMFPLGALQETDFFRDGLPCQHHEVQDYPKEVNMFHMSCMAGLNFVGEEFGVQYSTTWLRGGHSIAPIMKSTCEHLWKRGAKRIMLSCTPTRRAFNFYQYIYSYWQHLSGQYVDHVPERAYVSTKNTTVEVRDVIRTCNGILCVNDNECVEDIDAYATVVKEEIRKRLWG